LFRRPPWRSPWRSPQDQPAWARPLLLVTAALAGLAYGWGMARDSVEPYYGAAARSMAGSWHALIFGSFDPAGTVTVDKLPGALWLQALSVKLLGFHIWALVLPQVTEGVLTVLVLYRAVRRLAGPAAGLAAAVVLAATPVTVLLGRGNVSDSLLILLLVLAADATSAAVLEGGLRQLLLAGLWVGLAFQAKMIQAWLVLPALAAAYLLAAPAVRWRVRVAHVIAAGAVTAVVSLSWMTAVSLVPSQDRPYVDGSRHDSVFEQVFDYNGLARLGPAGLGASAGTPAPFLVTMLKNHDTLNYTSITVRPSWHRLLSGPFALDGGWLLPLAALGVLVTLRARRGGGRRDPLRAAVVLWGGWFAVLAVFFSTGHYLNSYYVAALTPAVAALCGLGVCCAGARPWPARVRLTVLATAAACAGYGLYLLHGAAAAVVPGWITPTALGVLAIAAVLTVLASRLAPELGRRLVPAAAGLALLILPAAASASVVARGLGPFDTPFESRQISAASQHLITAAPEYSSFIRYLENAAPPHGMILATDTALLAAPYILFSGREVLPIGGLEGGLPTPSLSVLIRDVRSSSLWMFVLPVQPPSTDPRVRWVEDHCTQLNVDATSRQVRFGVYSCLPALAK